MQVRRRSRVDRAMGIENTAGSHRSFGITKLQARRELRAIFVRKTLPYEPMPANATIGDKHRLGRDERAIDWLVTG